MSIVYRYYYGTKTGGLKAAAANKKRYGKNFYREMGRVGGSLGHTGGFFANKMLARGAGAKGGRNSFKGYKLTEHLPNGDILYKRKATGGIYIKKNRTNYLQPYEED